MQADQMSVEHATRVWSTRPGPGSTTWRVNGERLVVLGWGPAILLQFAHPLVAAGVAQHSTFRSGPIAPYRRLHGTVRAMLALTFGDDAAARQAIDRIRGIHDRVHGRLVSATRDMPRGAPYSAHDSDLLAWVHATLLISTLRTYDVFVEPLNEAERDRYCQEARSVGSSLGIPTGLMPVTSRELDDIVETAVSSGKLEVTPEARALGRAVLWPPAGWLAGPIAWLARAEAVRQLPADLRRQYGVEWTERDADRFTRAARAVRRLRTTLPEAVWRWKAARRDKSPRPRSRGRGPG
jgi:uncharacterized protein (DUF2236 family)